MRDSTRFRLQHLDPSSHRATGEMLTRYSGKEWSHVDCSILALAPRMDIFPVHFVFPKNEAGQLYGDTLSKFIVFLFFLFVLWRFGWIEASRITSSRSVERSDSYQETLAMWVIFAITLIPLMAYSAYLIWNLPDSYQYETAEAD